ncbi:MAG: NAD(P)H-dependent oxidoreductase subunit E [Deltaproteobacteria bacterium]|jgi:NADH:ubiquinone oxidoreductase subunit E|nr:NAD(P)H-dependent oxidoreductase subunit E [Deltaproteobacteria bacterium]
MPQSPQGEDCKKLAAFLDSSIDSSGRNESALIKTLYEAQRIFGYLPKEAVFLISERLNVAVSKVYGVISFYSFFTTKPKGRYQVKVCLGTACFVRGAEKIARELESRLGIKLGETSLDRKFSLESLRCVGACGLAPVTLVNGKGYGRLEVKDIGPMLEQYTDGKS